MKEWLHQLLISSLPGVPVVAGGPGEPQQPECTAAEDEDAQKMKDPAGIIMLEDQEGLRRGFQLTVVILSLSLSEQNT